MVTIGGVADPDHRPLPRRRTAGSSATSSSAGASSRSSSCWDSCTASSSRTTSRALRAAKRDIEAAGPTGEVQFGEEFQREHRAQRPHGPGRRPDRDPDHLRDGREAVPVGRPGLTSAPRGDQHRGDRQRAGGDQPRSRALARPSRRRAVPADITDERERGRQRRAERGGRGDRERRGDRADRADRERRADRADRAATSPSSRSRAAESSDHSESLESVVLRRAIHASSLATGHHSAVSAARPRPLAADRRLRLRRRRADRAARVPRLAARGGLPLPRRRRRASPTGRRPTPSCASAPSATPPTCSTGARS